MNEEKGYVTDADIAAEIREVAPGNSWADVRAAAAVVCQRLGSRDDDKTVAAFKEVLDRGPSKECRMRAIKRLADKFLANSVEVDVDGERRWYSLTESEAYFLAGKALRCCAEARPMGEEGAPSKEDRERAVKIFAMVACFEPELQVGGTYGGCEDTIREITAVLTARDEELVAAAREVIETLTCPDCNGAGTLGEYKGKPVACEKCYGHEDSDGLGYVLDGDNIVEKLNALAALVEGVGK